MVPGTSAVGKPLRDLNVDNAGREDDGYGRRAKKIGDEDVRT